MLQVAELLLLLLLLLLLSAVVAAAAAAGLLLLLLLLLGGGHQVAIVLVTLDAILLAASELVVATGSLAGCHAGLAEVRYLLLLLLVAIAAAGGILLLLLLLRIVGGGHRHVRHCRRHCGDQWRRARRELRQAGNIAGEGVAERGEVHCASVSRLGDPGRFCGILCVKVQPTEKIVKLRLTRENITGTRN